MMIKLKNGKKIEIHSYKHDGSLHRVWITSFVIEDGFLHLTTGNQKTKVIEKDGRSWYTKEPAICFFFPNEWFNIIAMLKNDGIHYYCNISSPYIYDGEAIKYIDYDLDIKIYPSGKHYILDQKEYELNSIKLGYPEEVKEIVNYSLKKLTHWIETKKAPFDEKYVMDYYEKFKKIFNYHQEMKGQKRIGKKNES